MSYPNEGNGIEDHDSSFDNRAPPNDMSNSAEPAQLGQTSDDLFLNTDSYYQRLYQLGPTIPGQFETMHNTHGASNGGYGSGTYVPGSHYQVLMSDQKFVIF